MEVSDSISFHLYSSYCNVLQYDEYCHRYSFNVESISERELDTFKSVVYKDTGRNISREQIRNEINHLFVEVDKPYFREEQCTSDMLFKDILPGETINVKWNDGALVCLIKFNGGKWFVLESNTNAFKLGCFIFMKPNDVIKDRFEGSKINLVYSGFYHDSFDKIHIAGLHRNNVSHSVSPLYECILETVHNKRVTSDWKLLLSEAGKLGFGSYVVRRLLDFITKEENV